jgi:hypothetical protein
MIDKAYPRTGKAPRYQTPESGLGIDNRAPTITLSVTALPSCG